MTRTQRLLACAALIGAAAIPPTAAMTAAPASAATPCPTPAAHVWCGIAPPVPSYFWLGLAWFAPGESA